MVMAAARAGGIIANNSNQKDFLENIEIQNSLLNFLNKRKLKGLYFSTYVFIQNMQKLQLKKKVC